MATSFRVMTSLKEAKPYSDAGLLYISYTRDRGWDHDVTPGYWSMWKKAGNRWKREADAGILYAIAEED